MSDIIDLEVQGLRDRAVVARRISAILSDEQAAKNLAKHALDLEAQAKELENRILRLLALPRARRP